MRRTALLALPVVGTLVLGTLTAFAAPAQAAVLTSTGVRCTIVGTAGADVLAGTSRRDVICGRGGNDLIRANGGDDLVDAGGGRDSVYGGSGADRLLAGSGADDVDGGDGADRIAGGDGNDDVSGAGGADTVSGGDGNDDVSGGASGDDLGGGPGDDEITGGAGADDVDGGGGDNLCIVDAEDESVRCRYDEQAPGVAAMTVTPDTVDVTEASAQVTVRVHATDDTGVTSVQGSLSEGNNGVAIDLGWLDLVSGTDRDGWYQGTVTVPRYTPGVPLGVDLFVGDRVGRSNWWTNGGEKVLEVVDRDPDTEAPQLSLATLTPSTIDVRTKAQDVTVSVHGTDAKAGVGRLDVCLSRPGTPTTWNPRPIFESVVCGESLTRTSGTARDGFWTTTLTVPQGSLGGTWNVVSRVDDRVSNDATWAGPEALQAYVDAGACCSDVHPFPDHAGGLTVNGPGDDVAPWVSAVTADPTTVDTFEKDATLHVAARARDAAGEGVTHAQVVLAGEDRSASAPSFNPIDLTLTSGTTADGWWTGDLVVPRTTPPGTYHLLVGIADPAHASGWTDPASPDADGINWTALEGVPTITVVDRTP